MSLETLPNFHPSVTSTVEKLAVGGSGCRQGHCRLACYILKKSRSQELRLFDIIPVFVLW